MKRRSNREVVDELVRLLTTEFPKEYLEPTKEIRAKLWKALREVERRLCPQPTGEDDV